MFFFKSLVLISEKSESSFFEKTKLSTPSFFALCKIKAELLFDAISVTFACVQLKK